MSPVQHYHIPTAPGRLRQNSPVARKVHYLPCTIEILSTYVRKCLEIRNSARQKCPFSHSGQVLHQPDRQWNLSSNVEKFNFTEWEKEVRVISRNENNLTPLPTTPLSYHSLHVWSLQLHIMLSSGVPLVTTLESIATSDLPLLAPVCENLAGKLATGYRLSEAMKSLGTIFSGFVISLVTVGENSGRLAGIMERISTRAARRDKMERAIKGALAYPVFLTAVSVGMALFMALYMFPRLLPFLNNLGVPLPWATRVLVWGADNLGSFILIATILALWTARLLSSSSDTRMTRLRDWLYYHSPVFGKINRERVYADCFNDLSLLLEAGCDLVSGMKSLYIPWQEYRQKVHACIEFMKSGEDFTDSVRSSNLFPERFLLQLRSGEETGKLAQVFKQLSLFLDEGIALKIEQLVTLVEPLILGFMGVVTGFIVLATFLPFYGMVSTSL